MNWSEGELGDFLTLKRGHDLPKGKRKAGEVPVVSSSGFTGWHDEPKAAPPGVVTGRYGTIGEVFYVDQPYWPLNTALYVIDFKGNDPRFVSYFLRQQLKNYQSDKAAVPGVDRNVLHKLPAKCPDPQTQQAIVRTLSAYDDLIENNQRRIALLEEAARQLYKEWFVRFRFPGHEHVKIIDGVPEGWEQLPSSEAMSINPTTRWAAEGAITAVPMAAVSESGMCCDLTAFEFRNKSTSVRFIDGDTLFARITPCLENGKTAFVNFLQEDEVACGSTEFIVLREKRISRFAVYLLAREDSFRGNAIQSMIGSSGRQRVQPSCFDKFMVAVPPAQIGEGFDNEVGSIFDLIKSINRQNYKLAQARDLLLPKLMNGSLAV